MQTKQTLGAPDKAWSRRQFLNRLSGSALTLGLPVALAACGGGGSDDGGVVVDTGNPNTPGGGTDPNPDGIGAAIDIDTRLSTIGKVEQRLAELAANPQLNRLQFVQAIAQFMAADPLYAKSGFDLDTACAWGEFTDGRLHVVSANFKPVLDPAAASVGLDVHARALAASVLPSEKDALVLQSFGPAFEGQGTAKQIADWLGTKGYKVALKSSADVAFLRTALKANAYGFLYINTHGGTGNLRDRASNLYSYSLQSSTLASRFLELDEQIVADLIANRLTYHSGANGDTTRSGDPAYDTRYGITGEFVKAYWKFAANSVVILNACDSANGKYFFYQECHRAGAELVLGWTGTSAGSQGNSSAYKAPMYFVDRMLGVNHAQPKEALPQRAFPWPDVMTNMRDKGLDVGAAEPTRFVALPKPGSNVLPILAPSIHHMEVDEAEGLLTLYGRFGTVAGRVEIDGTQLGLKGTWAEDRLVCHLPVDGPGSHGTVNVKVVDPSGRKQQSNRRHLTLWQMRLNYSYSLPGVPELAVDGSALIRLRADVGRRRDKIGEDPSDPVCHAYATRDSKFVFDAHGKKTLNGGTVEWKGNAEYWGFERPGDERHLIAYMKVKTDPSSREGWLGLQLAERLSPLMEEFCAGGCTSYPIPVVISSIGLEGPQSFANPIKDGPELQLPALKIDFGKDYSIPAGIFPSPAHPEWTGKEMFVRLAWDPVQPLSPPEDTDEI